MTEDISESTRLETLAGGANALVDSDFNLAKVLLVTADLIGNNKMRTAVTIGAAGYAIGNRLWSKYRDHRVRSTYRIRINENDSLYSVLQQWLIDDLPVKEQKNVVAKSAGRPNRYDDFGEEAPPPLTLFYDGSRKQEITINGHRVVVNTDRDEQELSGPDSGKGGSKKSFVTHSLVIECPDYASRCAVLDALRAEASKMKERKPTFRTAMKWGSFTTKSDIPSRPIETVVLKEGQAERILDDLRRFLSQEDDYNRIGVPYRRGVMLAGLPGTGKTSVAAAIAHELKLDVYYIALSAVEDDNTLIELLSDVAPRSVLLLEDVDVANAAKERNDDEDGITMSGLLNALDGFVTPHGLITIMTTNHAEVLDPALVRPGRIDLFENISAVDNYQVRGLCEQFLGYIPDGLPDISEDDGIIPAQIVEVFKRHLNDRAAAGPALVAELNRIVDEGRVDLSAELDDVKPAPKKRATRAKSNGRVPTPDPSSI